MDFSPRQIQILFLLLHADCAISAGKLAEELKISKRTIFREMNHVDRDLKKFHLDLIRNSHTGFMLEGSEEEKQALLMKLEQSDSFDPRNKEERQMKLLLSMIEENRLQKIYYYADLLQVSESTISNDLEDLSTLISPYHVELIRKAGFGVCLRYQEYDVRRLLLHLAETGEEELIPLDISDEIRNLIDSDPGLKSSFFRLTLSGRQHFLKYASLGIRRMKEGHSITETTFLKEDTSVWAAFSDQLMDRLTAVYSVAYNKKECIGFSLVLLGSKRSSISEQEDKHPIGPGQIPVRDLVDQMITCFDARQAYLLQEDELLINGLVTHLVPSINRIEKGLPIENILLKEEEEQYAELMERVRPCADLLSKVIGFPVPKEEVGLLAFHFGGALYRLDSGQSQRRTVQIGIVCMGGIGVSILMASKLQHHFGKKITTYTLQADHLDQADVDFLVSSFQFQADLPLYLADPMLPEEQLKEIGQLVENYAFRPEAPAHSRKAAQVNDRSAEEMPDFKGLNYRELLFMTEEVLSILSGFTCLTLDNAFTLEETVHTLAVAAGSEESATVIEGDIMEREKKSSQILEALQLAFLHAKTKGTANSRMLIAVPEGGRFLHPSMKGSRGVILMLLPREAPSEVRLLGRISEAVFEEEEMLESVFRGDASLLRSCLEKLLDASMRAYLQKLLEEK